MHALTIDEAASDWRYYWLLAAQLITGTGCIGDIFQRDASSSSSQTR